MYYLTVINIITLMAYIIDKCKANRHAWRIPEATLLGLAIIGGSVGALIGIFIIRHKSQHIKFKFGVPIILVLQIVAYTYLYIHSSP
ncbi:MAG: DUF1294 domain-containing protein [Prevotella sp.]|jgi:uncharacterized membrane protein YsdA (DUF1294 family)